MENGLNKYSANYETIYTFHKVQSSFNKDDLEFCVLKNFPKRLNFRCLNNKAYQNRGGFGI